VPPRTDVNTYLPGLRAVITTKWERGYSKRVIPQVEGFYVDSSLDNDADSWQIQLGDPTGDFLAMMNRDNEVRVELLSADPGGAGHIMTGISDDLVYDQDGLYTISGRDYASLALDSMVEPNKWKKIKPMYLIGNQAKQLGFPSANLNSISKVKKIIKTDGSETYWEFWYRLVRNDKAYIWCGPNGALILNRLNYTKQPTYYFGTPLKTDRPAIADAHIPVEGLEIRKSTQGRVYRVWTYVNNGRLRATVPVYDGSIGDWIKRPVKIVQDSHSHTITMAKKRGWLEIYEGKVGAVEIRMVISDPKFVININRMCRVRIPEIDFYGHYFIVGVKVQAGSSGFIQEIRLREKGMALSQRVPEEPRIPKLTKKPKATDTSDNVDEEAIIHENTVNLVPGHEDWGDYFWRAAAAHQGNWDFDIFLAWLMAIAKFETKFHNIRERGMNIGHEGVEWYADLPGPDPKTYGEAAADAILKGQRLASHAQWELTFANQIGTHGLKVEAGVGPMQLKQRRHKENADDIYTGGTGDAGASPVTAAAIDKYLTGKGSPMAGHGTDFVAGGVRNGYDPRMLVAISGGESSFGKNCFAPYNAWGWLSAPAFTGWTDAISKTSDYLGNTYINDVDPDYPNGRHTVAAVGAKWCPVGASNDPQGLNKNWIPTNTQFLREMGGDPNDISLQVAQKGKAAVTASFGHDQYTGGRWDVESNIMEGARYFKELLDETHMQADDQTGQMAAMEEAFSHYNGAGKAAAATVRKSAAIFVDPARAAYDAVKQAEKEAGETDMPGPGTGSSDIFPLGWPNNDQIIAAFRDSKWFGVIPSEPTAGPVSSGPLNIQFLQAKQHRKGRYANILWIVIHTMENNQSGTPTVAQAAHEPTGAASGCAQYFSTLDRTASAHYCVDEKEIWQSVYDADTAYGTPGIAVGPGIPGSFSTNDYALHIEHGGSALQTAAMWGDNYSQAMLRLSARLTAQKAKKYGITVKHLTNNEITSGVSGFVGHDQMTALFGGDHTDPGVNFPWDDYIQMVKDAG